MPPQPPLDPAAKLARFPLEVRDAYRRFGETRDPAALHLVILAVLRDHLPKPREGALTEELRLIEDLGFDSLAVAEIVFFFEDLFQVRIENRELLEVRTVGEVARFVARKIGEKPAAP
jgi:acyl carrier protein